MDRSTNRHPALRREMGVRQGFKDFLYKIGLQPTIYGRKQLLI